MKKILFVLVFVLSAFPAMGATFTGSYLGADADKIRPGTGLPDGNPDYHITVSGLRAIPTKVTITSDTGGIWQNPYNSSNWDIATDYSAGGGKGDFWFAQYPANSFHITVSYATGAPDEADVSAFSASYKGTDGDKIRPGTGAPDGNSDYHISVSGLKATPTKVTITSDTGGIWQNPYNFLNWDIVTDYSTGGGKGDFWFAQFPANSFHVTVFYANGARDEADVNIVQTVFTAAYIGTDGDKIQPGIGGPDGNPDYHISVSGLKDVPTKVVVTSDTGGVWQNPYNFLNWYIVTDYSAGGGKGEFWFAQFPANSFHLTVTYANGTTEQADLVKGSLTVGPFETVMSKAQRDSANLPYWPDGTMGVFKSGLSYSIWAANSERIGKAVGTLTNPVQSGSLTTSVKNPKANYDYYGGGPIYRDPVTGTLLMFAHTERFVGGSARNYWATIAMAKSTDGGNTWTDLGEIVSPTKPITSIPGIISRVDIGGGTYVIIGNYIYVYFNESGTSPVFNLNIGVARALLSDVLNAAAQNTVTPWLKYYNGVFSEPGLGGLASDCAIGRAIFPSVSYNQYLGRYIMVAMSQGAANADIDMLDSADGITWGNRQRLETDPGMSIYPSIVGLGADPTVSDRQFYVYYLYSVNEANNAATNRWTDGILARRLITLGGS